MGNDNKIKIQNPQEIHDKVMLFLGDELTSLHKSSSDQLYDIESEYEKTKKNRSAYTTVALVLCCLIVGGLAFTMTKFINTSNKEIAVSLQEFDDLNLKNLLDTVSTAQVNYDNAVKNKAIIEAEMEVRLKNAQDSYDNDVFVLDSMKFSSKKRYNKELDIIKARYRENVKAVHDEFDQQVIFADKEVEAYKAQLAEFDAAKVASAREQEKALDTERKLRDLEQKRLTEKYEKRIAELNDKNSKMQKKHTEDIRNSVVTVSQKYQAEIATLDPQLNDENANEIILAAEENPKDDVDSSLFISENSSSQDAALEVILTEYQKIYDDYKYLDDEIASLPLKNSIPNYKKATRNLVNQMGETFLSTTTDFYKENLNLNNKVQKLSSDLQKEQKITEEKLENQRENYESVLVNLLTVAKTNAIITKIENEQIDVFVAPKAAYLITTEGANAEFKADKTIKGKIFRNEKGKYYFEVGSDKEGNKFEVDFSKIEPGLTVKILSK